MTVEKRYEILKGLPPYGPLYISVTESGNSYYSQGLAVRFFKKDGTNWIANFEPGQTEFNGIYELNTSKNLIVFAGGKCYFMDGETPTPVAILNDDFTNAVKTEDVRLVLYGRSKLTIIEADGEFWQSEEISWEWLGLGNLQVKGNIVTGMSCEYMQDYDSWTPFTFNIDTKVLTKEKPQYNQEKPWWKFW